MASEIGRLLIKAIFINKGMPIDTICKLYLIGNTMADLSIN